MVFPGIGASTCRRLGLRYFPDSSYKAEVRLVSRAIHVADRVIEQEQGRQGQLYFGVGVCAHARPMLPRVRKALDTRGLDEFKVVLASGIRPLACLEDLSTLAQTRDGRTIVLNTFATSGMVRGDNRTPVERRRDAERERHLCDHPNGRVGTHSLEDVSRAIDCAVRRADHNCVVRRKFKRLVERVLQREGFVGWEVLVSTDRPDAKRQYLASSGFDSRLRQVSLELTSSCDWRYERRKRKA